MLGKEVVRKVMKLRGMGSPTLAKKLGYETVSGVTNRFAGAQDMRCDTLAKMLEALDCEVIVKSKLSDRTVWVINGTPENAAEKE